jgi:hypothetical protein
MSVRFFIQDRSGNNNLDIRLDSSDIARNLIQTIRTDGGYEIEYDSITDDFKFVPWHRIDFIEVTDDSN